MKNWLKIILISLGSIVGMAVTLGVISSIIFTNMPHTGVVVNAVPPVKDRPLLEMINELRAEQGVTPLTVSPELNASAKEKLDDMLTHHYYDHVDAQGVHGYTLIFNHLPQAKAGSENLMLCGVNDNNRGAFEAWKKSPAHYKGMIDPTVTLYGTASAWDSDKGCRVFVNHFAAV